MSEITTAVFVSTADNKKYFCPKHGITTKDDKYLGRAIDRTPHIEVTLYEKPIYYCLHCYADFLEKNISRLSECEEKNDLCHPPNSRHSSACGEKKT